MYRKMATLWKPLLMVSMVGLLTAACGGQAATPPAQVQQRETIGLQTKACTAEEFRRLPFGLKWDCPSADFKPPVGTNNPINIAKLMADENTKDAKRGGILRRSATASTSVGTLDVFRHTCCSQPWISLGEMLIHRTAAPEFKLKPYLAVAGPTTLSVQKSNPEGKPTPQARAPAPKL